MNDFVLHPDAVRDLDEIWEYIAVNSLDAADRTIEEIYETIQSLVPFPYIGPSRPDLTSRPLRFQSLREYLIIGPVFIIFAAQRIGENLEGTEVGGVDSFLLIQNDSVGIQAAEDV